MPKFPASVRVYPREAGSPEDIDVSAESYYYQLRGPATPIIRIGQFSDGLGWADEKRVVATLLQMKQQWRRLNHVELYVGAVRLYNFGYRNEAVYWYYSAGYLQDLYWRLADARKMGPQGTPSMDMYTIGEIFDESAAPKILGFGYCNDKTRRSTLSRHRVSQRGALARAKRGGSLAPRPSSSRVATR